MKQIRLNEGLSGEKGLIVAVMATAANDAINSSNNENLIDAWAYFNGSVYRHHITALGLPGDIMPASIEHMSREKLVEIAGRLLNTRS